MIYQDFNKILPGEHRLACFSYSVSWGGTCLKRKVAKGVKYYRVLPQPTNTSQRQANQRERLPQASFVSFQVLVHTSITLALIFDIILPFRVLNAHWGGAQRPAIKN